MTSPTRRARGERHPNAKLTEDVVQVIRWSDRPHRELAERFGVSRPLIGMVKARKIWRHVE